MDFRNRLLSLALVAGEATVTLNDGVSVTGTITYVGANKFRLDTPLAANFISYDEVQDVT